jgi:hypothetical protein
MTDSRRTPPPALDPHEVRVSHDLQALRDSRERDLPSLAQSVANARSRRPAQGLHWRDLFMASNRPLLAAGLTVTLLVAAVFIPVSYPRTTGHQVALTLTGLSNPEQARPIAVQLKAALHADHVALKAQSTNGSTDYTLEAPVPSSAHVDAAAIASAFAQQLNARGYHAAASTTPIIEMVSGNVYAYARDLVVNVETSGKTAAQIQAEIQQQLAAGGIPDATVSVTDEGKQRKVTMEVKRTADGNTAPEVPNVTLNLTKDGKPAGPANAMSIQERRMRSAAGTSVEFIVVDSGRTVTFTIDGVDKMSDAALQSAVTAKLLAAGITAKVTVVGGKVTIEH